MKHWSHLISEALAHGSYRRPTINVVFHLHCSFERNSLCLSARVDRRDTQIDSKFSSCSNHKSSRRRKSFPWLWTHRWATNPVAWNRFLSCFSQRLHWRLSQNLNRASLQRRWRIKELFCHSQKHQEVQICGVWNWNIKDRIRILRKVTQSDQVLHLSTLYRHAQIHQNWFTSVAFNSVLYFNYVWFRHGFCPFGGFQWSSAYDQQLEFDHLRWSHLDFEGTWRIEFEFSAISRVSPWVFRLISHNFWINFSRNA
jgi:hypothetical protein